MLIKQGMKIRSVLGRGRMRSTPMSCRYLQRVVLPLGIRRTLGMNTMKNKMPRIKPIMVERIGFVDTRDPSNRVTLVAVNPAIRNTRGRNTTIKIWRLDNLEGDSIVVSIPGFL